MKLENFKKEFNKILADWVYQAAKRCKIILHDDDLSAYITQAEALINRDGKRIRPYLMALTYSAYGGLMTGDIHRIGIILELFHNFALMHDDIVDRGTDRNGIITLHRHIKKEIERRGGVGDIKHVAEGQTIFVGDLILIWANRLWDELETFPPERIRVARHLFNQMAEEAILGQIIDIDMMARETANMELIRQKMRLKTASYTFVRPMQIGASLVGSDPAMLTFAEKFGTPLGMAFQIQDDLFDLILALNEKHKTALSDLRTHQQNIFTQFIFDNGTSEHKAELLALLGSDVTEAERPRILDLFTSSGALNYGIEQMNMYFKEALLVLETSKLPEKYQSELRELVMAIRNRKS